MDPEHDEPTEEEWANMSFKELIARSSFGTPEAVALRATCPREVVDEILARLRADWSAELAEPAGSVHAVDSDTTETERRAAMSTAGIPPEEFRAMYCGCSEITRAEHDQVVQDVADELSDGDLKQVITAIVYSLQDFSAQITGIPSDMWSAVIAETDDHTFRTRIECDYIEHGFAFTWLAFKERFPEGRYVVIDDEDDWAPVPLADPDVE